MHNGSEYHGITHEKFGTPLEICCKKRLKYKDLTQRQMQAGTMINYARYKDIFATSGHLKIMTR